MEVNRRNGLGWSAPYFHNVGPASKAPDPKTKIEFSNDKDCLAGKSSVLARVTPSPGGNPIALLYPKSKKAGISLAGKTHLVFWSKFIDPSIHSWKGLFPTITLYKSDQEFAMLRPADDPRNFPQIEERVAWMYRSIPLRPAADNPQWKLDGQLPDTVNWITIEFEPLGNLPLRVWIDGLGIK